MQMAGNRTPNLLKKIVGAILLGICCTLVLIQDDAWFKKNLGVYFIREFSDALDCQMIATAKRVNVFAGTFELENITVDSNLPEAWRWQASNLKIQFSWLSLLLYGSIDLQVELDKLQAHSGVADGQLAIMTHLKKFTDATPTVLPLFVRSLTVAHGQLAIVDQLNQFQTTVHFHSESKKIHDALRSSIYFFDGHLIVADKQIFTTLSGTAHVDIAEQLGAIAPVVRIDCSVELPQLPVAQRLCFVTGTWENGAGSFVIKNGQRSLMVDPIKIYQENNSSYVAQLSATIPASYLLALYKPDNDLPLSANCTIQAKVDLNSPADSLHGHVEIQDLKYEKLPIDMRTKFSVTRKAGEWRGGIGLMPFATNFAGSWHWSEHTGEGALELTNSAPITMPATTYWQLPSNAISLSLRVKDTGEISGKYQAKATHSKLETSLDCAGVVQGCATQLNIDGSLGHDTYELTMDLKPQMQLKKLKYKDAKNVSLIDVTTVQSSEKKIEGTIDFAVVKSLFKNSLDIDLQGEGSLRVAGALQDNRLIFDGSLQQGTIRLPGTYNFINQFDAHFVLDSAQKKLSVENLRCGLHQGNIQCKRAVVLLDDAFNIKFAHMPCVFESCLINRHKDLFATVSGRVLMTKKSDQNTVLKGTLFIDRAQLNKNIFSQEFRKGLQESPSYLFDTAKRSIDCDVTLITKEPIHIKTGFLETSAHADLTIKNDIRNPEIAGHIMLGSGSLAFPYKELMICKGDIYCLPHQPFDPLIELVAKNKIKKYNVALHITGSVQNPYVLLESSPVLTEEQIVSLLLVGSEDESLNIVVPALLMQNIKNILLSSDQTYSTVNAYFAGLLKPFKNIRLVPRLNDQTGRGGLRAALEMEVGERWRVMMQKNFSLPEDTRFELEYLLSDEISLKGVRDERGDVRGEVEMRWKFGK